MFPPSSFPFLSLRLSRSGRYERVCVCVGACACASARPMSNSKPDPDRCNTGVCGGGEASGGSGGLGRARARARGGVLPPPQWMGTKLLISGSSSSGSACLASTDVHADRSSRRRHSSTRATETLAENSLVAAVTTAWR
ncbi:hypothetical protein B0H12DRAFT_1151259 [Mycena haematopus]|nr:hypothetical protein B0H12DRAFT_1151259 [Mycena haematopus]